MIQTDIFTIATSALNVQQGLLNTTSNNIANVNTDGYIRQRGSSQEQNVGGVTLGDVERVVDRFAQEQQQRDVAELGEADAYLENLNRLDTIFASEAISAAEGMSRYFAALQDATDDPNNLSSRQIAIGQADAMMDQFNNLNTYMANSVEVLNESFDDTIGRANDLVQQIADLNTQIKTTQFAPQTSGSEAVKNQRDQAILELSRIVSVDTQPRTDGSTLVFMRTGQSLVLEDGTFNLFSANGDPDPNYKQLSLQVPANSSFSIPISDANLGGELAGLIRYREEVLEPNRRELGKIALSLTDAMNEQNKLGMDLDGQLGGDIFTTPTFGGLAYDDNTSTNTSVNARVPDGSGGQITSADYQLTITAVGGGNVTYDLALLNPDGSPVLDSSGNAIVDIGLVAPATAGTFTATTGANIGADLEIEFPSGAAYQVNDQFLLQPAKQAAGSIALAINRPEDLALASPVRVSSGTANLGSAEVSGISVTNTIIGTGNDQSAFVDTPTFGLQQPGSSPAGAAGVGAPASIVFTAADTYEVYDADTPPSLITTVAGATNLNNLLGQASATAGWTGNYGAAVTDYPGFDLSIEGVPRAGDTFAIEFNTNGFNNNANGLALSGLQDADTTLQSNNGNTNSISFHEAYTGIVGDIGTKTATGQVQYEAAVALERQSREWVDSVSGVNLDEEAANLIRFQQAYSANARVLTTAQSLFQTILGALG